MILEALLVLDQGDRIDLLVAALRQIERQRAQFIPLALPHGELPMVVGTVHALRPRHLALLARVLFRLLESRILGNLRSNALLQLHAGHLQDAVGEQQLRVRLLLEALALALL